MKIVILILMATLSLIASEKISEGEKVYQNKCASCHIKITTKDEALQNIKALKAPPMVEVSSRLKEMIKITDDIDNMIHKGVVVAFIKDYVINPDLEKSMCHAMALDRFGTMPTLKGKISDEELQSVAEWIYDYFEGKKF